MSRSLASPRLASPRSLLSLLSSAFFFFSLISSCQVRRGLNHVKAGDLGEREKEKENARGARSPRPWIKPYNRVRGEEETLTLTLTLL